MVSDYSSIVRKKEDSFDREVEGLIEMCKYLSQASEIEKSIVKYMNFNPHVVIEARRRVFNNSKKSIKST